MKTLVLTSAILMGSAVTAAQVSAAEFTLRFGHQWPAVAGMHKNVYQTWADEVQKASGGRIEVEMYPSAALTKPPAMYDSVKKRIQDVSVSILGYSAGRFPLTQIVELPHIVQNATQGSCVIQSLYDEGLIADEFQDTHPLFLFTHGQGHIHTVDKPVSNPSDLEGLRIRRPTTVVGLMLEGLGAQPVGMPAPESYQAAQRGVIDGVSLPWEGQVSFRLNELTNYHTEVGGLYSLAFVVAMNKDLYNSMPADLQKVLDDASGKAWAKVAGTDMDRVDTIGRQQAVDAGHTIITVEGGAENPAWKPILDAATEQYLSELEAQGKPARAVYARAHELADSCL